MTTPNKLTLTEIFFILLPVLLPFIYMAWLYPHMPERVPIHFDAAGTPNGYGTKKFLCGIILIMGLFSLGLYLLVRNLPAIDPKRTARLSRHVFQKVGIAVVTLIAAINIIILYSAAAGRSPDVNHLLYPLLGLFFAYLGNIMYSVKPNYFVGIRTPWTLENEDNWRATHRLGSKVFFIGGICIAIGALLTSSKTANIILAIITAIMVLIPVVYSFVYFKKHEQKAS